MSFFPSRRVVATLFVFVAATFAVLFASAGRAEAYPWMIRHEYAGCIPCHADPSGAGVLTAYGRAQGELLLRTRYSKPKKGQEEEAGDAAKLLWFIDQPDWLLLGASGRVGVLETIASGTSDTRVLDMQSDGRAQITLGRVRASGSLGYINEGAQAAWVTHNPSGQNLISREHWLGVDLGEDKNMLLRAGRMNLPFGIRVVEHNLLTRMATQTDINDTQEHGVAFSFTSNTVRFEVMSILGNFQVNGDEFRHRGGVGFAELTVSQRATVGISSLVTYVKTEPGANYGDVRMAHGAFARVAPAPWLAIMAEGDALVLLPNTDSATIDSKVGGVGSVQLDFEPIQGLHPVLTLETQKTPQTAGVTLQGWASVVWFFAPHADVRVDFVDSWVPTGSSHANAITLLPQLHLYL